MVRAMSIALFVLAAHCVGATAQSRPSFDCAKAAKDAEKAICASPALSTLDRDLAAAYATARSKLDGPGRNALSEDQASFLQGREFSLGSKDTTIESVMRERLSFLRAIRPGSSGGGAAGFVGTWKADYGAVKIAREPSGKLAVEISTFAPVTARWICEVSAIVEIEDGALSFSEDDARITLAREGTVLRIVERRLPERRGVDYCGANGSIDGRFFKAD